MFQIRFQAFELLAVLSEVPQQPRLLKLRLEDVLLITLSNTIARFSDLFDLLNQRLVMCENLNRLLEVGKALVSAFNLFDDAPAHGLEPVPG